MIIYMRIRANLKVSKVPLKNVPTLVYRFGSVISKRFFTFQRRKPSSGKKKPHAPDHDKVYIIKLEVRGPNRV